MKSILKIELNRAFKNKGMYVALIIGLYFALKDSISGYITLNNINNNSSLIDLNPRTVGLYENWMMSFNKSGLIILFIMPLLIVLPYSVSYHSDIKSGVIKNICIRVNKKKYLIAKYISVFLSGAFVSIFPLVVNILINMLYIPIVKPYKFNMALYGEGTIGYELFYNNPMVYIIIYLIIFFIFFGVIATISLVVTNFIDNKFSVLVAPFLFLMFLYLLSGILGNSSYSPFYTLQLISSPYQNYTIAFIEFLIIFILSIVGFFFGGTKNEIY